MGKDETARNETGKDGVARAKTSLGLDEAAGDHPRSPLWMVTREPLLNEFVHYLSHLLALLQAEPDREHELVFSRAQLGQVRRAFSAMILRGEKTLHQLSELCSRSFFSAYQLSSVAVGEIDHTRERFVLSQGLVPQDLFSTSDLDLGTRQLAKLRFMIEPGRWSAASLVANFVEYQPTEPNAWKIHKLISRIKAEEEIWNKVVDEIFDLDGMVRRDKQMSHLSSFVKDVFGLKIVVGMPSDVEPMHRKLCDISWDPELLEALGREATPDALRLEVLESKNYLSEGRKTSGWAAMKSVVSWCGKTFEIQIQPLRNYFHEQEYLTRESHAGFKARRELLRDQIAERMPLFGFYRSLLRWLFVGEAQPEHAPVYPSVKIRLGE